jgi:hypothetical protein
MQTLVFTNGVCRIAYIFQSSLFTFTQGNSGMEQEKKVYAQEVCGHCEGEKCTYCDKQGFVLVAQPAKKCRHCGGDGCIYCGYTGWTDVLRASDPRCREWCSKSGTE